MAQSDGNLNVRTDGLRPSVQAKKFTDKHKQTENTQKTLGVIHLKELISIRFIYANLWQKN
jgi:hypothetical protein